MSQRITAQLILRVFLGLVVLWFGSSEIISPQMWVTFVPPFMGSILPLTTLVLIHGIVLCVLGIALIAKLYVRAAASILALMLAQIVLSLIVKGGLSATAVRDFGLLGAALALAVPKKDQVQ